MIETPEGGLQSFRAMYCEWPSFQVMTKLYWMNREIVLFTDGALLQADSRAQAQLIFRRTSIMKTAQILARGEGIIFTCLFSV